MKKIKLFLAAMALTTLGLTACQNNADLPVDYAKNNKAVISVELDLESYTAEIGESFQIKPLITYKDDNEVEVFKMWKSSNTRVATVDDEGLVRIGVGGCDETAEIEKCLQYLDYKNKYKEYDAKEIKMLLKERESAQYLMIVKKFYS